MFQWFKKALIDKAGQQQVARHIKAAETKTTGEIRVFMETECKYPDPMLRAREVFTQLKMERTERHNAVLIYLASESKMFAILADAAIYEKAGGQHFWDAAADKLREKLKSGHYTEGICACIDEVGMVLEREFPFDPAITRNELPDQIVFGK